METMQLGFISLIPTIVMFVFVFWTKTDAPIVYDSDAGRFRFNRRFYFSDRMARQTANCMGGGHVRISCRYAFPIRHIDQAFGRIGLLSRICKLDGKVCKYAQKSDAYHVCNGMADLCRRLFEQYGRFDRYEEYLQ